MLTIFGNCQQYCDGVSRRDFLRIGGMGIGGLTLADLLHAESASPASSQRSQKAIINVHLGGGPPHLDMFDLKPEAPREYRGEFSPIATNVPGFEICELFPQLAERADQFSVVRSLIGSVQQHDWHQTASGWSILDLSSSGGRPTQGAVVSKLLGSRDGKAPPHVDFNLGSRPGFLGPSFGAYSAYPYGQEAANLRRQQDLTDARIDQRVGLIEGFDRLRRRSQETAMMESYDTFTQQAINVLTTGKVGKALDLGQEDPRVVARYRGERASDDQRAKIMATHNDWFLYARRLIEAGVRCVSFNWGGWDTHVDNFVTMRSQLPKMDVGLSSLIDDLTLRGLIDDVMVVVWGEFGRTPQINNNNGGRDHWPMVACAMVFGGGIRGGQVIGATDRRAEFAVARPVQFQELHATFYHLLGIDVDTQLADHNGRPQFLLDHRQPVAELL